MFKRALVSVSDKTNLAEYLKPLVAKGLEVVSTGGTAQYLKSQGIKVTEIESVTGFPEVLGGRVKTLHPKVHMGLLAVADNPSHQSDLQTHAVELFDLVICNLYAFEQTAQKTEDLAERIEHIDIGGVTLLRAAAKNFQRITVICEPSDYALLADTPSDDIRRELAVKAFLHTSTYDLQIAQTLTVKNHLRYGENPHQWSAWLPTKTQGLHQAKIHQGKELSYNNILDLDAALRLVRTLKGAGCVVVKHNNPCGVAVGKDATDAFEKAFAADSVSGFGGIVAMNSAVTEETAGKMLQPFLECVIAPAFEVKALEMFKAKKNLRILEWPELFTYTERFEVRSVSGGLLVQDQDQVKINPETWKVYLPDQPGKILTAKELKTQYMDDIYFGISVAASLKSNSIAIVKNQTTLGLGMGQVNRVDSVKLALERWQHFHPQAADAVLAGDAFFPFADSIEMLDPKKVSVVVQPGGSMRDEEVIKKAQEKGLIMVLTGQRHFRH